MSSKESGHIPTTVVSKPLLKLKLLELLRQGTFDQLQLLIRKQFRPINDPLVQEVLQLMLHYAVQVSPMYLIKDIVTNWTGNARKEQNEPSSATESAQTQGTDQETHEPLHICIDLNHQDQAGNTPLHLAAYQARADVVAFLMDQPTINDCVVNDAHLQPIEVCKNLNIAQMMQIKRANYVAEIAQEFRIAFNNRDFGHLESILSSPRNSELLDINGWDPETGDTVLHEFVKKRDVFMCRWLLEHGADPFRRDPKGVLPIDLLNSVNDNEKATNTKVAVEIELKKLLAQAAKEQSVIDVTSGLHQAPTCKGYLRKWTNFAQGYRLRWFILSSDGKLSYFKDQADTKNACRGSLNMSSCSLHLDSSERLKFEIIGGDNGAIRWHLKGNHPVETNRWVWAIQGAIRFAKDRELMMKNGNIPQTLALRNNVQRAIQIPQANTGDHEFQTEDLKTEQIQPSNASIHSENNALKSSSKQKLNSMKSSGNKEKIKGTVTEILAHSIVNKENEETQGHKSTNSGEEYSSEEPIEDLDEEDEDDADTDFEEVSRINGYEQDEDDLENNYGPNSQKMHILQKTIIMEVASLRELFHDRQQPTEIWDTAKNSLATISDCFQNLNNLVSERDEKLLSMLTKQKDVNNIWIQSVKDLEMELTEKTERLAFMDKERRNLKKIIHKRLGENNDVPDNENKYDLTKEQSQEPDTLEEVAKFIEATKDEDEESDTDEFFDAEDLVEASERHLQEESLSVEEATPTKEVPAEEKEGSSTREESSVREDGNKTVTFTEVPEEKEAATVTEVSGEGYEGTADSELTLSKVYRSVNPITELQRAKEKEIVEDGSFLGYEDGIRLRLALDQDERPKVSLWSVLKSMVGKDLTKMPLPVTFNEPTSMLQRVAEDLEYSTLLDRAATFEDSTLRLLYVAVFSCSPYSSTIKRVAKPFNPLLGETFEYSRPDRHFRLLAEQVSHHPPVSAISCESPKWDFWGASNVKSHFNGRSFAFNQLELWHLNLRPDSQDTEEFYSWKKPDNTLVGILVGSPEIDSHGDIKITNHTNGDYCILHFKARGWRASGAYEVTGEVYNTANERVWILGGHWNDSIYAKKVVSQSRNASDDEMISNEESSTNPKHDGSKFLVWKVHKRPPGPFNLTSFAITLNAEPPQLKPWLAPTDTRLRPDQRAMEDGQYQLAEDEKLRLEEKQRAARRIREENNEEYRPRWFVKQVHPITKKAYWKPNGAYWAQRKAHHFTNTDDIF